MDKKQLTFDNSNNQLLYFTSTSLLKDGSGMVFISDRAGAANLFYQDFRTGEERQLTFVQDGLLKSYVYFDGTPYQGFGKASVSLNEDTGNIYYIHGRSVMKVNVNGAPRKLCELPDGQMTGFTHVSRDDKLLCVPTVDAEAFDVTGSLSTAIDQCVQEKGLSSYLRIIDTETGETLKCETVNRAWITHVQFSPVSNDHILYNHEWASDCGIRRVWLWDGKQHIRLRSEDAVRSKDDWACHEVWADNGRSAIYHGGYKDKNCFIGKVDIETLQYAEIAIDPTFTAYGHFTVHDASLLVSDGYYRQPDDPKEKWAGYWISLQRVDWERKAIEWIPLCKHGSSWNCQCSHPHPIFDHKGEYVYFTSDESGYRQIYRCAVKL